jgi:hypothetical protein
MIIIYDNNGTIYGTNGFQITQADNVLQYKQLVKVLKYQIHNV